MKKILISVLVFAILMSSGIAFAAKKAKAEKKTDKTAAVVKAEKKTADTAKVKAVKHGKKSEEKVAVAKAEEKPAEVSSDKPAGGIKKVCDSTKSFLKKGAAFTVVTCKKVASKTVDVGKGIWSMTIGKIHKAAPKTPA
jgi:hypothetical protein